MSNRRHNKVVRQAFGPYGELSAQRHTVTNEEEGIPNSVSIDLLTVSPTREHETDSLHKMTHTMRQQTENQQRRNVGKDAKRATRTDITVLQDYVVSRIMHHVGTPKERRYVVRWHAYDPGDNTQETPHHIPTHFACRYWIRLERIRQRAMKI